MVLLNALFEHALNNVVVFDQRGTILCVSRSAAELMGAPAEHFFGRCIYDFVGEETGQKVDGALAGEIYASEGAFRPRPSGSEHWMRSHWCPLRNSAGEVVAGLLITSDVSPEKHAEERAEKLASIDPVTELPNQAMLAIALARALSGAKGAKRQLALVWVNLDRFKDVNDALGREAGDELLHAVGAGLSQAVRATDMVARVGGDDFAVVLMRVNSRRHLERLIRRVHDVFAAPFAIRSESVLLSASSGVAVRPGGGADGRELQENAHTAMRTAKELGGDCYEIFEPSFSADARHRLRLAAEIRDGIDLCQFRLHYQPQVRLETMSVQAVEALARWQHPERGLLAPDEFIDFAEETGLILALGPHLLERALQHVKVWQEALEAPPRLAINVSAAEFQRADVCADLERLARRAGVQPAALEVEITETAVIADPAHAAEVARCLREAGVSVALDDFGTGYSSLTHLRELPIDRVKIDRSFVTSCLSDRSAASILVAVTNLAHELGLEVVAEGVETQEQLDFLRGAGCDAAQGYLLSRPLAVGECTVYLQRMGQASPH